MFITIKYSKYLLKLIDYNIFFWINFDVEVVIDMIL